MDPALKFVLDAVHRFGSMHTAVWTWGVLPLVLALVLAGCGGGGGSSTTATVSVVPSSPAASTYASSSSAGAVASVAGVPISKSSYEHWLAVEKAGGTSTNAGHRALSFLITSQWVIGEAAARKLTVSEAEVKQRFAQISKQSFPKAGALQKFLAKAEETEADLLARVKVELLESRITAQVTAGKSAGQHGALLASFEKSFHAHWKALTSCQPGYVMEDCKQYRGAPEDLTAPASGGTVSSSGSKVAHGSASAAPTTASSSSSASGEVYTPSGTFSISSPAFERNGVIPAQYTCAGAGISPPLSWEKVPAGAAELFLFVIDDSSNGSEGGQRWVVGGIDPSSKGIAAGQLPPGAIVGTNSAGKATYSPICPPQGKSNTIEFVLYALSKKINISPGFQPAQAESQYGQGKLLMGESAVTYGIASRP